MVSRRNKSLVMLENEVKDRNRRKSRRRNRNQKRHGSCSTGHQRREHDGRKQKRIGETRRSKEGKTIKLQELTASESSYDR